MFRSAILREKFGSETIVNAAVQRIRHVTMTNPEPQVGQFYRHYKGGVYKIMDFVYEEKTARKMVVYQSASLFPMNRADLCSVKWARPLDTFFSEVNYEKSRFPRFILLNKYSGVRS
jgi:hypothetical protein